MVCGEAMGSGPLFVASAVVSIALGSAATGRAEPPVPASKRPDALGRPVPWGDEVKGLRLSLQLPRTRLLFGQPIELSLVSVRATDQPPYLRVRFDEPGKTATVEFTT